MATRTDLSRCLIACLLMIWMNVRSMMAGQITIDDKCCVHVYDGKNAAVLRPFAGEYEFKERPVNERPLYEMQTCANGGDCSTYRLRLMSRGWLWEQWRFTASDAFLDCEVHRLLWYFECIEYDPISNQRRETHSFHYPVPKIVSCGETRSVDNGLELDVSWMNTYNQIGYYIFTAVIATWICVCFCCRKTSLYRRMRYNSCKMQKESALKNNGQMLCSRNNCWKMRSANWREKCQRRSTFLISIFILHNVFFTELIMAAVKINLNTQRLALCVMLIPLIMVSLVCVQYFEIATPSIFLQSFNATSVDRTFAPSLSPPLLTKHNLNSSNVRHFPPQQQASNQHKLNHSASSASISLSPPKHVQTQYLKQSTISKYVQYLLSFIDNKHNQYLLHSNHAPISIDNFTFSPISPDFILRTLSNKRVVVFGDSLAYYALSYLVHTVFHCTEYRKHAKHFPHINNTDHLIYCRHLQPNQSLILDQHAASFIENRDNLETLMSFFDASDGRFRRLRPSWIYLATYNITIHLYYQWGVALRDMQHFMHDYLYFVNKVDFDVMLNNMLNMHWPHCYPTQHVNYNLSIPFMLDMEHVFMQKMVALKKEHQCLIFGPVNPVIARPAIEHMNYGKAVRYFMDWLRIQSRLLLNRSYEIMNETDIGKIRYEFAMSTELQNADQMELFNTSHFNVTDDKLVRECIEFMLAKWDRIPFRKRFFQMEIDANMMRKYCVLYRWGFGSNLIQHRMKQFVMQNEENYAKKKVFYHDQYSLYSHFDDFPKYMKKGVHFYQLAPIAWTNILNIVANGC